MRLVASTFLNSCKYGEQCFYQFIFAFSWKVVVDAQLSVRAHWDKTVLCMVLF